MVDDGCVGFISGMCFCEFGVEVICVDKDVAQIAPPTRGAIPSSNAPPEHDDAIEFRKILTLPSAKKSLHP